MNPYGILVKPFSEEQLTASVLTALNLLGVMTLPVPEDQVSEGVAQTPVLGEVHSPDAAITRAQKSLVPDDGSSEDTIPICSGCKQIREADGSWTQIEDYLRSRYNLWFTHGLCPECVTIYLNWTTELADTHKHGARRERDRRR